MCTATGSRPGGKLRQEGESQATARPLRSQIPDKQQTRAHALHLGDAFLLHCSFANFLRLARIQPLQLASKMVNTLAITLVALAAAAAPVMVSAHSQMTLPNPKFSDVSKANSPLGTVDGPTVLPPPTGQSYAMGTDTNIKAYVQAFKAQTKYTSLKQLIMDNYVEIGTIPDRACGLTDKTYAQPLPTEVEWQAGQHPGPCEVWCDDTLAFHNDDCATNYPGIKLPYDRSKCVGKKVLWSMFLAMHVPQWQVYMGCTAIEGSDSSTGSSTSTGSSSSTPAPKATTKAPTAASTPAPSSADEYDDETSSPASASTPASTPAPAATKKKCTAKTRRLRN